MVFHVSAPAFGQGCAFLFGLGKLAATKSRFLGRIFQYHTFYNHTFFTAAFRTLK
jgi:hypothetical protein